MKNLNDLRDEIHAENKRWWTDLETGLTIERNRFKLLSLVISEISEALEGERKDLMDDKLPHRKMAEVEMADAFIRLLDFAGGFGHKVKTVTCDMSLPDNKGECLFYLTEMVIRIGTSSHSGWISSSLAYIRRYCDKHGYELDKAVEEKRAYNRDRADHKHENPNLAEYVAQIESERDNMLAFVREQVETWDSEGDSGFPLYEDGKKILSIYPKKQK